MRIKTTSLLQTAIALSLSCTFFGLDDVDARSCGGGSALEQSRKCAHLNSNAATRSADPCRTWQCLGLDNRRRCGIALRDDDADRVPAAICAMDLPEAQRDCNDSPDALGDAGLSGVDNHPGNTETCDGKDQDCDGIVDDGVDFSRRLSSQNVAVQPNMALPSFAANSGKVVALQGASNRTIAVTVFEPTGASTAPMGPNSGTAPPGVFDYSGDDRPMAVGGSRMNGHWLFASTPANSTSLAFSWSVNADAARSIAFASASDAGVSDSGILDTAVSDASVSDGATDAGRDTGVAEGGTGVAEGGTNALVAKAVSVVGANGCASRTFAVSSVQRSISGTSCDSGTVRFRAMRVPFPGASPIFASNFGEATGPTTSDRAGVQMLAIPSTDTATISRFLTFVSTTSGVEVGMLETSDTACPAGTNGSLSYTRVDTLSGANPTDVTATWAGTNGNDSRVALAFRNGDCAAGDTVSLRLLLWNDTARTITATRMEEFAATGARSVGVAWVETLSEAVVAWYSQAGGAFAVRGRRVSEIAGPIEGEFAFRPTDANAAVPASGSGRLFLTSLGDHVDGFLLTQINGVSTFVRLSIAVATCN